jgi:hypothetical protein
MKPTGPEQIEISYNEVHEMSLKLLELLADEEIEVGTALFALTTTIVRLMRPQDAATYDQDKEMAEVNGIMEYLDAVMSVDKKES